MFTRRISKVRKSLVWGAQVGIRLASASDVMTFMRLRWGKILLPFPYLYQFAADAAFSRQLGTHLAVKSQQLF
jgi:hypothetical protein